MKYITSIFSLASGAILVFATVVFADGAKFPNPTGFPDIQSFIAGFLKAVVILSLPVIALFIVISGFKFLSARGNSEKLGAARKNFYHVVLGAALILGAWALAVLIWGTVNPLINGNGTTNGFYNSAPPPGF